MSKFDQILKGKEKQLNEEPEKETKRTSINFDADLLKEAKIRCVNEGLTLTKLIDLALRNYLAK